MVYLGEHSHQDSDLYSAELKQRVADSHHQFLASSLGRYWLCCAVSACFFFLNYLSFFVMFVVWLRFCGYVCYGFMQQTEG